MVQHLELAVDALAALRLANSESVALHQQYVGTEHLLLGLVQQSDGSVATALRQLNVSPTALREFVESTVKPGSLTTDVQRPLTTRTYKVLDEADAEANSLGHASISTADLFIGLLREKMGIGAQVLVHFGVDLQSARAAFKEIAT